MLYYRRKKDTLHNNIVAIRCFYYLAKTFLRVKMNKYILPKLIVTNVKFIDHRSSKMSFLEPSTKCGLNMKLHLQPYIVPWVD